MNIEPTGSFFLLPTANELPKEDGEFYQFCYVSDRHGISGASTPFQFRKASAAEFVEIEEDDMLVVRPQIDVLREKIQDLEEVYKKKCVPVFVYGCLCLSVSLQSSPCLFSSVSLQVNMHLPSCLSPWYNHKGWLGVKHQVIYLITLLSVVGRKTPGYLLAYPPVRWPLFHCR